MSFIINSPVEQDQNVIVNLFNNTIQGNGEKRIETRYSVWFLNMRGGLNLQFPQWRSRNMSMKLKIRNGPRNTWAGLVPS